MSHAIIIPIYCENRNTIILCNELQNFGAEHIVVVNDGLNPKSEYFNELTSIGCHLVHLKITTAKVQALKQASNTLTITFIISRATLPVTLTDNILQMML